MAKYSRLVSVEEKRNRRRAFFFFLASIILFLILIFFGIPTLARIAAFLADLRSSAAPVSITDNVPPAPPRFFAQPLATNEARIVLTGTAEAGATVKIFQDGKEIGEVVSGDDGTFQKEVTFSEGENLLKALALDQAGNESQESEVLKIVFDKDPPQITITSPSPGETFSGEDNRLITITGSTNEETQVTLNDRVALIDPEGNFSYQARLEDGENKFNVLARDKAGNETSEEIVVSFTP